jgi:hypothetical protein
LVLFQELTKASDGMPYITDDLTLGNLSFLWRHAWLSKLLKFKAEDWKIVLKLFPHTVPNFADLAEKQSFLESNYQIRINTADLTPVQIEELLDELLQKVFSQNILDFACPKSAFEFLEKVDHLKATGFTPDELNWLLAGDRTAKSALKETDAAQFLDALRQELQAIKAEYDPTQYGFLTVTPPTDVDGLMALLTSLLQKLNRSEAEVSSFLAILRGGVLLEASVQGLPSGFTFPAAIVSEPNHIPIQYEPNKILRFSGLMTDAQRQILLSDASLAAEVKDNPSYQNAIADLFQQSSAAVTNYVSIQVPSTVGITLPSDRPSIPIRHNAATQTLSFIGVMTTAEQSALKLSNPAATNAIDELFQLPRLAVKFYEPIFTASLEKLPSVVDFQAQLP